MATKTKKKYFTDVGDSHEQNINPAPDLGDGVKPTTGTTTGSGAGSTGGTTTGTTTGTTGTTGSGGAAPRRPIRMPTANHGVYEQPEFYDASEVQTDYARAQQIASQTERRIPRAQGGTQPDPWENAYSYQRLTAQRYVRASRFSTMLRKFSVNADNQLVYRDLGQTCRISFSEAGDPLINYPGPPPFARNFAKSSGQPELADIAEEFRAKGSRLPSLADAEAKMAKARAEWQYADDVGIEVQTEQIRANLQAEADAGIFRTGDEQLLGALDEATEGVVAGEITDEALLAQMGEATGEAGEVAGTAEAWTAADDAALGLELDAEAFDEMMAAEALETDALLATEAAEAAASVPEAVGLEATLTSGTAVGAGEFGILGYLAVNSATAAAFIGSASGQAMLAGGAVALAGLFGYFTGAGLVEAFADTARTVDRRKWLVKKQFKAAALIEMHRDYPMLYEDYQANYGTDENGGETARAGGVGDYLERYAAEETDAWWKTLRPADHVGPGTRSNFTLPGGQIVPGRYNVSGVALEKAHPERVTSMLARLYATPSVKEYAKLSMEYDASKYTGAIYARDIAKLRKDVANGAKLTGKYTSTDRTMPAGSRYASATTQYARDMQTMIWADYDKQNKVGHIYNSIQQHQQHMADAAGRAEAASAAAAAAAAIQKANAEAAAALAASVLKAQQQKHWTFGSGTVVASGSADTTETDTGSTVVDTGEAGLTGSTSTSTTTSATTSETTITTYPPPVADIMLPGEINYVQQTHQLQVGFAHPHATLADIPGAMAAMGIPQSMMAVVGAMPILAVVSIPPSLFSKKKAIKDEATNAPSGPAEPKPTYSTDGTYQHAGGPSIQPTSYALPGLAPAAPAAPAAPDMPDMGGGGFDDAVSDYFSSEDSGAGEEPLTDSDVTGVGSDNSFVGSDADEVVNDAIPQMAVEADESQFGSRAMMHDDAKNLVLVRAAYEHPDHRPDYINYNAYLPGLSNDVGAVYEDDDTVRVAFKGTDSTEAPAAILKRALERGTGISLSVDLHRRAQQVAKAAREHAQDSDKDVWFYGHSYGAQLAADNAGDDTAIVAAGYLDGTKPVSKNYRSEDDVLINATKYSDASSITKIVRNNGFPGPVKAHELANYVDTATLRHAEDDIKEKKADPTVLGVLGNVGSAVLSAGEAVVGAAGAAAAGTELLAAAAAEEVGAAGAAAFAGASGAGVAVDEGQNAFDSAQQALSDGAALLGSDSDSSVPDDSTQDPDYVDEPSEHTPLKTPIEYDQERGNKRYTESMDAARKILKAHKPNLPFTMDKNAIKVDWEQWKGAIAKFYETSEAWKKTDIENNLEPYPLNPGAYRVKKRATVPSWVEDSVPRDRQGISKTDTQRQREALATMGALVCWRCGRRAGGAERDVDGDPMGHTHPSGFTFDGITTGDYHKNNKYHDRAPTGSENAMVELAMSDPLNPHKPIAAMRCGLCEKQKGNRAQSRDSPESKENTGEGRVVPTVPHFEQDVDDVIDDGSGAGARGAGAGARSAGARRTDPSDASPAVTRSVAAQLPPTAKNITMTIEEAVEPEEPEAPEAEEVQAPAEPEPQVATSQRTVWKKNMGTPWRKQTKADGKPDQFWISTQEAKDLIEDAQKESKLLQYSIVPGRDVAKWHQMSSESGDNDKLGRAVVGKTYDEAIVAIYALKPQMSERNSKISSQQHLMSAIRKDRLVFVKATQYRDLDAALMTGM